MDISMKCVVLLSHDFCSRRSNEHMQTKWSVRWSWAHGAAKRIVNLLGKKERAEVLILLPRDKSIHSPDSLGSSEPKS